MVEEELKQIVAEVISVMGIRNCSDHSGLVVWIKVGCGLLTVLIGVFSWNNWVIAPEIKAEIARQAYASASKFDAFSRDIAELKATDTRIIAQRNLDHANPRFKLQ